jgi:ribonuclease-3
MREIPKPKNQIPNKIQTPNPKQMPKSLDEFETTIGVSFNDSDLLKQAFIHRSYLNENPSERLEHNERLEFLGDAVLELVVTEYLYKNYPNPEGELTNWRSALVNAQTMGRVAEEIGVNDFLYLSRGEARDTGRARQIILANALEAIIGAIYLDQGYEVSREFINRYILNLLPAIIEQKLYRDAKSLFQEIAQDKLGVTPTYEVISETGPDHAKRFRVAVMLSEQSVAEGEGDSKQEAEQEAARNALLAKGWH